MTTFAPPAPERSLAHGPTTTTAAPERSIVQRLEALENANRIRTYRAGVKRDLKARRVSIYDLLLEPVHPMLETAKVYDLLLATPKYGRVKANKVLQLCRISASKTVGGLTHRQRVELVSTLRR